MKPIEYINEYLKVKVSDSDNLLKSYGHTLKDFSTLRDDVNNDNNIHVIVITCKTEGLMLSDLLKITITDEFGELDVYDVE